MEQIAPTKRPPDPTLEPDSLSEKLLALVVEFASRASGANSLDELSFILTNDLRALAHFDRSFLITHFGGQSVLMAATHTPTLDKKSSLQNRLEDLAELLRDVDTPLVISRDMGFDLGEVGDSSPGLQPALEAYAESADWQYLCCLPLVYNRAIVGHLLMEYAPGSLPDKAAVMAIVKISPVFAAALSGKWLLEKRPKLAEVIDPRSGKDRSGRKVTTKHVAWAISGFACFVALLFLVPFTFSVGGEAVIAPKEKEFAFCRIAGLIDAVFVKQGSFVERGQKLATLDPKELDHRIRREERQFEIFTKEMALLRSRAIDDPSMLAKTKLLELKRDSVGAELEFLKWQHQFLTITAPVAGVIATKDVETLTGKRLEAGEAFCEIAEPGQLRADIYVPEDRVMRVQTGQQASLYLNSAPTRAYPLTVEEIAPRSDVEPRLGNVYKVSAAFVTAPGPVRVGMKGIGSIDTGSANLWTLLGVRLSARWNQFLLHFF